MPRQTPADGRPLSVRIVGQWESPQGLAGMVRIVGQWESPQGLAGMTLGLRGPDAVQNALARGAERQSSGSLRTRRKAHIADRVSHNGFDVAEQVDEWPQQRSGRQ